MISQYAADETSTSWVAAFSEALDARDAASAAALFGDECFWRDLAAFTWNVKTLEGRDEIAAMLAAQLDSSVRRPGASRASRPLRAKFSKPG